MIAHVAGMPIEELLVSLLVGTGALFSGVGALLTRRRHSPLRARTSERSSR
jgi:hypothetical protein